MTNYNGLFAKRLRLAREMRRMGQDDLAKYSGIHSSSISHFESGRREPNLENLRLLAISLKVPTDYLLGIECDTLSQEIDVLPTEDIDLAKDFVSLLLKRRASKDDN